MSKASVIDTTGHNETEGKTKRKPKAKLIPPGEYIAVKGTTRAKVSRAGKKYYQVELLIRGQGKLFHFSPTKPRIRKGTKVTVTVDRVPYDDKVYNRVTRVKTNERTRKSSQRAGGDEGRSRYRGSS